MKLEARSDQTEAAKRRAEGYLMRVRYIGGLTARRVIVGGAVLLAVQVVALGYLVAGAYGVVTRYAPSTVSFVTFYAAGQLATDGHPVFAYDDVFAYEAEETLTQQGGHYLPFLNPSVYLLLCAPLALLSFLRAFILFVAATLAIYLVVVRRILDVRGHAWLLPALAFPPTIWTVGYGQNSFLTAALFGAGTLLIDRRPAVAGVLFGMLCYKPQFALLVPVALLAGRRWSAIIAATASIIILCGLSITLFGWETWEAYLRAFFGSTRTYNFEITNFNIFASLSPFATARLLGLSIEHARIVQLAATLAAALLVAWVWSTNATRATRAAVLTAGP
ncbi:MAG TPA: glycosyltransferase family 87 protein [Stellaceae bacterium]|nr:glycosyltransferase family 87 protein [Stellaceae bacterium]